MSFDALNDAVERNSSSGGTWVDLKNKGDRIEGAIIAWEERPRTFEGQPVLTQATGKPRYEWVFTLQTGESDGVDDDGVRKVAIDERGQDEVKRAVRDAGVKVQPGGTLLLAIVADRQKSNEMRHTHLRARYTPPTIDLPGTGLDDF